MALKQLSRQQLMRRIEGSNQIARKAREKSAHLVDSAVQTAVGGATAFGVTFASAKFGGADHETTLGPIPLELAVGAAALTLGLTGMGGEASKYLLAGANGALCAWAANQGRKAAMAAA